jgi:hypothetical protein
MRKPCHPAEMPSNLALSRAFLRTFKKDLASFAKISRISRDPELFDPTTSHNTSWDDDQIGDH